MLNYIRIVAKNPCFYTWKKFIFFNIIDNFKTQRIRKEEQCDTSRTFISLFNRPVCSTTLTS